MTDETPEVGVGAFGERIIEVDKLGVEWRESLAKIEATRDPARAMGSVVAKAIRAALADGAMLTSIEVVAEGALQHPETPGDPPVEVFIVKAMGLRPR